MQLRDDLDKANAELESALFDKHSAATQSQQSLYKKKNIVDYKLR